MAKKQVRVQGQGKTNLKRGLLNPIRNQLQSTSEDFTKSDWNYIKSDIKGFAKDGRLSSKDLTAIQSGLKMSTGRSGLTNSEGWLAQGAIRNQIDGLRYSDYVDKQSGRLSAFTNKQSEIIGSIMSRSSRSIASQLDMIRTQADQSLGGFQSMLDMAMSQSQAINAQQRAAFDEANQASEQAIRQYQSQIASLPGFTSIDQIGGEAEQVSGWNPLQPIGVQRQAATVQRTPAMTGFSSAQMASSSRQRTGIQGFRGRAA